MFIGYWPQESNVPTLLIVTCTKTMKTKGFPKYTKTKIICGKNKPKSNFKFIT